MTYVIVSIVTFMNYFESASVDLPPDIPLKLHMMEND